MQLVLERGSIDKPLTFDVGLIFIPVSNAYKGVFNPNVTIFQSNCTEGLHFSAFRYFRRHLRIIPFQIIAISTTHNVISTYAVYYCCPMLWLHGK